MALTLSYEDGVLSLSYEGGTTHVFVSSYSYWNYFDNSVDPLPATIEDVTPPSEEELIWSNGYWEISAQAFEYDPLTNDYIERGNDDIIVDAWEGTRPGNDTPASAESIEFPKDGGSFGGTTEHASMEGTIHLYPQGVMWGYGTSAAPDVWFRTGLIDFTRRVVFNLAPYDLDEPALNHDVLVFRRTGTNLDSTPILEGIEVAKENNKYSAFMLTGNEYYICVGAIMEDDTTYLRLTGEFEVAYEVPEPVYILAGADGALDAEGRGVSGPYTTWSHWMSGELSPDSNWLVTCQHWSSATSWKIFNFDTSSLIEMYGGYGNPVDAQGITRYGIVAVFDDLAWFNGSSGLCKVDLPTNESSGPYSLPSSVVDYSNACAYCCQTGDFSDGHGNAVHIWRVRDDFTVLVHAIYSRATYGDTIGFRVNRAGTKAAVTFTKLETVGGVPTAVHKFRFLDLKTWTFSASIDLECSTDRWASTFLNYEKEDEEKADSEFVFYCQGINDGVTNQAKIHRIGVDMSGDPIITHTALFNRSGTPIAEDVDFNVRCVRVSLDGSELLVVNGGFWTVPQLRTLDAEDLSFIDLETGPTGETAFPITYPSGRNSPAVIMPRYEDPVKGDLDLPPCGLNPRCQDPENGHTGDACDVQTTGNMTTGGPCDVEILGCCNCH